MKSDKYLVPALILLSMSIVFSGIFIGRSIQTLIEVQEVEVPTTVITNEDMMNLKEAAVYLGITEEKLVYLIDNSLYTGIKIPYFKFDNEIWFSKTSLSLWIIQISENNLEY